ncbi:unnamed protein product [Somion occarium]
MPSTTFEHPGAVAIPSSMKTYPLRLPSYRASYLGRYHPYSRKSNKPVDLMKRIDLPFEQSGRLSSALSVVSEEDEYEEAIIEPPANSYEQPKLIIIERQPATYTNLVRRMNAFAIALVRHIRRRSTMKPEV